MSKQPPPAPTASTVGPCPTIIQIVGRPGTGLILKLENYGIIGNLLLWFKDYLSNRHQKVFINGVHSSEKPISAGVPQGSVLGPLLFLIYLNDITDNLTGMARLFADDTSLSLSSTNLAVIERVVNDDLFTLKEWATKWLITFHPQKTEVMLISILYGTVKGKIEEGKNRRRGGQENKWEDNVKEWTGMDFAS